MKITTRYLLLIALAVLLGACDNNKGDHDTTAAPAVTGKPADMAVSQTTGVAEPLPEPGQVIIDLAPGAVAIRATDVNELEILEQLAAMASFDLLTGDIQWSTVTVDIHAENLHAALTELLDAYPYQIVYKPEKDTNREVLSEVFVSPELVPVEASSPTTTAPEDSTIPESEDDTPDPEFQKQLQDLKSDSEATRAAAAENIEPSGEALVALTELLASDPSPEVRIAITRAFEFSDDPLAIQALVACLKDEYVPVLLECISTLEHIGDKSAVAKLQPLLEHDDASVRDRAAQAIENLE